MSTSTSTKRRSILPPVSNSGPQAPVNASSSAKISDNSILTGEHSITIQSESIIHPRSKLESTSGSILVGRRCIIHERTHIGATDGDETSGGVVLGDYVTVEVGSVIEAGGTDIGEGTVVGVHSRIGRGAVLGKNCTITPKSVVQAGEKIPDFTVIYSNGRRRLDNRGVESLRHKAQARQVDVLQEMNGRYEVNPGQEHSEQEYAYIFTGPVYNWRSQTFAVAESMRGCGKELRLNPGSGE